MTDREFRAENDAGIGDTTRYLLRAAMARATCQWLDDQGKLWPWYHAWRDSAGSDGDGAASFEKVMGKAPGEADGAWRAWVGRMR